MREVAILKAYELGIRKIKKIKEYTDYVEIVGAFDDIDITYQFYKDGRIIIC